MRRILAVVVVAAGLLLVVPAAQAHPLGNFSVNHVSFVEISDDRIDVTYVLDQAEIPTLQERGVDERDLLARKRDEISRGLQLRVDGREISLTGDVELDKLRGQAGLDTTRVEAKLSAPVDHPRRVVLRDQTFPGRVGWKAVVPRAGERTAVTTAAPANDPTNALRRYPKDTLDSPADRREASFAVEPGDGSLTAPRTEGGQSSTDRAGDGGGFASLFEDAAAGQGVLVILLLAAAGWGALHALSPGHGKAMVAAYLAGTRGTPRHAVALGLTVTVTHTIGVFALGVVAVALSQYVLPEDLYPWLTLASGLMVVAVGAGVLRSRLRRARARETHQHHHHHHAPEDLSWKGLIGMGTAAGLIPCPSALVVLLAAISQHEIALGLLLIVAFSAGLAATLTALGLLVVYARRVLPKLGFKGRIAAALPVASALVIVGIGFLLAARAVPEVIA